VLSRILIYIAIIVAIPAAARADSNTVLVFPFENLTGDRTLDWIGEGISELVYGRLQTEPGVYVLSREERIAAYEKVFIPETALISHATELKLGWDNAADNIIIGSFSGSADDFHIVARLIDMDAGAATEMRTEGKLQDVIPLTTTLAWQLLKKIVPGTASPESDYTARPPTPRSAFENYIRALLNQDLQKRIDLLQTAVRLHPRYSAALYQLGRTYHLQRDFTTSNEWLGKLPDSAPERRQVLFLMGLNALDLGDHVRAITIFQLLPQTAEILLNLGAAYSRNGDAASAMTAWKRAAAMDPLAADVFFNMGYASFIKGDLENAEKNLEESLKLRGRDSEALFLLGRTYERQGRVEDAKKLITRATRLSTRVERWINQPIPKLERFVTATTFRSHDEVWSDRRLARKARAQDVASWLDMVQANIDSYLFGDALRDLRDMMKVYPDSLEARSFLNEIVRRQNTTR
jgi:tetratricopeptide (TPR) repeat protein/TolB-like protein